MKKAISILLIVAMAASLCMTAFAAKGDTVTRECNTCDRPTMQTECDEYESFNCVVECPYHAYHDADEYYVHPLYECAKCGETSIDWTTRICIRYKCPSVQ